MLRDVFDHAHDAVFFTADGSKSIEVFFIYPTDGIQERGPRASKRLACPTAFAEPLDVRACFLDMSVLICAARMRHSIGRGCVPLRLEGPVPPRER